jgi:predicted DNA-binding antitoxin AbrB/MazE fold protein
MTITIEAVYEGGVLKPAGPLPLKEHDKVTVTIVPPGAPARGYGLIRWTGPVEDLDYLLEDVENDPLEAP